MKLILYVLTGTQNANFSMIYISAYHCFTDLYSKAYSYTCIKTIYDTLLLLSSSSVLVSCTFTFIYYDAR